jgi:pilus assembly protein Flp/PilA
LLQTPHHESKLPGWALIKRALGDNFPGVRLLMASVVRFLKDENAATAIEYGLIAAGIAVAIISVVKGVGTKLNTTFSSISTQLK